MSEIKRVTPGDPIHAAKFNRMIDRLNESQTGNPADPGTASRVEVDVFAGDSFELGEIIRHDDYEGPTNEYDAAVAPLLSGVAAGWASNLTAPLIAAEPIPIGEYGRAVIAGRCVMRVLPGGGPGDYVFWDPTDPRRGKPSKSGFARIIEYIDGDHCLVSLGDCQHVWRYVLRGTGAIGTVPADLVSLDSVTYGTGITLSDPLGLTRFQKDGDSGHCVYSAGAFYVMVPQPQVLQIITDLVIGDNQLTIERKNLICFGTEDVPDEVLDGAIC